MNIESLYEPTVVEHPDEFIRAITNVTAPWVQAFGNTRPWFRGMSKISFDLEPSLLRYRRDQIERTEKNLLAQFKAYGTRLMTIPHDGQVDLMATMQHHGVPTRLLDWSENALAALFFAVRDFQYLDCPEDAVVWMLDPIRLTKIQTKEERIVYISDKLLEGALPLPIYPIHRSIRLTPQRGAFTLHAFEPKNALIALALKELQEGRCSPLRAIRIKGSCRNHIRQPLTDAFGVGDFTLFPDLDGLARELRMRENLEGRG